MITFLCSLGCFARPFLPLDWESVGFFFLSFRFMVLGHDSFERLASFQSSIVYYYYYYFSFLSLSLSVFGVARCMYVSCFASTLAAAGLEMNACRPPPPPPYPSTSNAPLAFPRTLRSNDGTDDSGRGGRLERIIIIISSSSRRLGERASVPNESEGRPRPWGGHGNARGASTKTFYKRLGTFRFRRRPQSPAPFLPVAHTAAAPAAAWWHFPSPCLGLVSLGKAARSIGQGRGEGGRAVRIGCQVFER